MAFQEATSFRSSSLPDPFSREALQPAADYILAQAKTSGHSPTLGIICGSGLGELATMVEKPVVLPYADIPGFPVSTAPGHQGRLIIGRLSGMTVILMQGRLHAYEGHPLWKVTMPVRVMRMVGANTLVVTNAVGSINPTYQVGDIMLVCDHINMFGLAGNSPLRGPNDESFGPRFFALNGLYDIRLRELARSAAKQVGIEDTLREGVLTITGGPNYESVAELKMFAGLGVDCVGMSSIPESLVAHHSGMKVLAFSLAPTSAISTPFSIPVQPPTTRRCLTQRTQRRATSRSLSPSSSRIFTSTSSTSTTTAMEFKRTEQKSATAMDPLRAREQVVMDHYQTAAQLHHRGGVWLFSANLQDFK